MPAGRNCRALLHAAARARRPAAEVARDGEIARTDDAGLPGEVDAMLDAASAAIPPPWATTNDSEGADR